MLVQALQQPAQPLCHGWAPSQQGRLRQLLQAQQCQRRKLRLRISRCSRAHAMTATSTCWRSHSARLYVGLGPQL